MRGKLDIEIFGSLPKVYNYFIERRLRNQVYSLLVNAFPLQEASSQEHTR